MTLLFFLLLYPEAHQEKARKASAHAQESLPIPPLPLAEEDSKNSQLLPAPRVMREPIIPQGGGMLIVIDDMGENMDMARSLVQLPYPVTFSVWPHSRHAKATAQLAQTSGRDVFIHLPMEPQSYPRIKPGQGALMADSSPEYMEKALHAAIKMIPYAMGINNHMGSRFTCNAKAVEIFCRLLENSGLVILDSVTHEASLLYATAHKAGLPSLRRNIFLDTVKNERHILAQLAKARTLARAGGLVVVIGHPYPQTLAALRRWKPDQGTVLQARQLFPPHNL